jgi:hypothetical protein
MKSITFLIIIFSSFNLISCSPTPTAPPEVIEASNKIDQGLVIGIDTFAIPAQTRYIKTPKGVLNNGYTLSIQNLAKMKTIKYAYVHYDLYDGVGDVVKSNITWTCRGPIDTFHTGLYGTESIVGTQRVMDIYRIDVEYMNGSKITVGADSLMRGKFSHFSTHRTAQQLMEYRNRNLN